MMTADSLQLTAYGPDGNEMRIAKDLPKAKTPHVWADSLRPTAYGMNRGCWRSCMEPLAVSRKPMALPDALVYELYGL